MRSINASCRKQKSYAGSGASHGLGFAATHEAVTSNARGERTRSMVLATLISLDLHASRTSIANLEPRYASPEKSNAAALIYLITLEQRSSSSLFSVSSHTTPTDPMAPKKEKAPPPSSKPAKSGGGKQKKKKWSKGKQKEKVNNMVLFDQATYDKLLSEAPKYKLITPSVLSDRMRNVSVTGFRIKCSTNVRAMLVVLINVRKISTISGSLARKAIRELMARGSIRMEYNRKGFRDLTCRMVWLPLPPGSLD
ncbi:hypothetical protein DKX38_014431 [Salix brachista]|uniref:40S ribosomal protein S25 n=1 Tax=Salix brachista TaxID=2182728 RepID=A0A5N5LFC7_9ROSI|nr:hypothetical protein DKX38_014431 [Salix brachista]